MGLWIKNKSFFRALSVLLLPTLEFITLRFLFSKVLDIRIGWPSITDYELLLPVPIAFFFCFHILEREKSCKLHFRLNSFFFHLSMLTFFFGLTLLKVPLQQAVGNHLWYIAWWILCIGTFLSSLFVFVPFSFVAQNSNRWCVLPCLFIALSIVLYQTALINLWSLFSPMTATQTCSALKTIFGFHFRCMVESEVIRLVLPSFAIIVGKGCGGFDGLLFGTFAMLLFYGLLPKRFNMITWFFIFFANWIILYEVNIFRLVSLFVLGTILPQQWVVSLFHTHAGWILLLSVEAAYIYLLQYIKKMETQATVLLEKI